MTKIHTKIKYNFHFDINSIKYLNKLNKRRPIQRIQNNYVRRGLKNSFLYVLNIAFSASPFVNISSHKYAPFLNLYTLLLYIMFEIPLQYMDEYKGKCLN